jgi:type I restriction enzyme R subunit
MIHKFETIRKRQLHRENIYVFIDEAHRSVAAGPRHLPDGGRAERHDHRLHRDAHRQDGGGRARSRSSAPRTSRAICTSTRSSSRSTTKPRCRSSMLAPSRCPCLRTWTRSSTPSPRRGRHRHRGAEQGARPRGWASHLPWCRQTASKQVAAFVAEHFKENVDPLGYKAFLVAVIARRAPSTSARSTSCCRPSGPRRLHARTPTTSSSGRTVPSFSSRTTARRMCACCSRRPTSSPRSSSSPTSC